MNSDSEPDSREIKSVLIGGVSGLAAAILGAAATGWFSYAATVEQNRTLEQTTRQIITAEADRAQSEFVRAQRTEVYSEYLAASIELENSLERYSHVFAHASDDGPLAPVDPVENTEKIHTLRTAYSEWVVEAHRVQLLSPDVFAAQEALADHVNLLYSQYLEGQAASLIGTEGRRDNWTLYSLYDENYRVYAANARATFSKAAQEELGISELSRTDAASSK